VTVGFGGGDPNLTIMMGSMAARSAPTDGWEFTEPAKPCVDVVREPCSDVHSRSLARRPRRVSANRMRSEADAPVRLRDGGKW
jgi:hypothetical protein